LTDNRTRLSSPNMPARRPIWFPTRAVAATLAAVAMACTTGCLGPKQESYVTHRPIDVQPQSDQAERLWDATGDVLRRFDFQLDRTDWREGVITTLPETSRTFFEFWRKDVQTDEDLWESIINPIRRWVEVRFHPDDHGEWHSLSVCVHKQRLTSLDRQFNSTGAAYQFFGTKLPATTGEARVTGERDHWLDIGNDDALAAVLLERICEKSGLPAEPATN